MTPPTHRTAAFDDHDFKPRGMVDGYPLASCRCGASALYDVPGKRAALDYLLDTFEAAGLEPERVP